MEELVADNASLRPTNINKKDDIQAAIDWMKKGRVDTRGFSKVLPHTSQDLRDGKVTPDQVANDLKGVYSTGGILLEGEEMEPLEDLLAGLFFHITIAALPHFCHTSPRKLEISAGCLDERHGVMPGDLRRRSLRGVG
jgi:hypothetical protein